MGGIQGHILRADTTDKRGCCQKSSWTADSRLFFQLKVSTHLIEFQRDSHNISAILIKIEDYGPDVLSLLRRFSGAYMTHSAQETPQHSSVEITLDIFGIATYIAET